MLKIHTLKFISKPKFTLKKNEELIEMQVSDGRVKLTYYMTKDLRVAYGKVDQQELYFELSTNRLTRSLPYLKDEDKLTALFLLKAKHDERERSYRVAKQK